MTACLNGPKFFTASTVAAVSKPIPATTANTIGLALLIKPTTVLIELMSFPAINTAAKPSSALAMRLMAVALSTVNPIALNASPIFCPAELTPFTSDVKSLPSCFNKSPIL